MKEAELKKYEIDFQGIVKLTAISVNPGHSEFHWMEER